MWGVGWPVDLSISVFGVAVKKGGAPPPNQPKCLRATSNEKAESPLLPTHFFLEDSS